jgi:hypothetical protein
MSKNPDLAYCKGITCKNKKFCYRYLMARAKNLAINFKYICNNDNEYKWFVTCEGKNILENKKSR